MNSENLKETIAAHNFWLRGDAGGSRADLTSANLTGVNLTGVNLTGAYLRGADLLSADLRGAYLRGADLTSADLTGAYLRGADLTGVNLTGAYLRGADLTGVNLTGADLRGAYLRGADLRAFGDMRYLKTLQIDTWAIGYTHDTLQIGCQRHPICVWRMWKLRSEWIEKMDARATEWSQRLLPIVLQLIDSSPAEGD